MGSGYKAMRGWWEKPVKVRLREGQLFGIRGEKLGNLRLDKGRRDVGGTSPLWSLAVRVLREEILTET